MAPAIEVTTTVWGMEYSAHECPKRHKAEAEAMFPGVGADGLLVVPTCQRTKMDLVRTGDEVDVEKDFCLERFIDFAKRVTDELKKRGRWCDYIDPCSGLSMINRESQHIYGEVDALVTLLNYQTTNSGCCKVVLHPKWGSAVYPASLFAKCSKDELAEAIAIAERDIRASDPNA
ncbi:Methylmalonic aciduria and homocystinuria type D protein [Ostreococcus tauri]|uniref:Methylmalonic aciduria and homocystinuria type D protein n=1 Tax=Ostreococcus tauri TaxID=70448 RepID=A0A090N313_OSTTA|nr:Methylmalonic aciduria and homocystinuria type D protein [Ostreococcus tauri]CEF97318.1 Methylmalonic aciduria and homocystinuria type D protein [Ostreococcus tauri]|eukprot:XP_022838625.1 Methylmalonic aciduria and homocystinuria type D protein [Ostreococcus tauri]